MSAKNGDVGRAEQRAAALKLRSAGANYETISRHLDCSTSTAWRHVQTGLRAIQAEPAEELRLLENARLDALLLACWPAAMRGSPRHVDSVLKIMTRRAALWGLDAPRQIAVSSGDHERAAYAAAAREYGLSVEEVQAQAEFLLREYRDGTLG